ncbi:hypothetical protein PTSG_08166 [Salpingoeca rosetta]|uniref:Glycosyl transferase CAP10 domain-containing protein n=1 Tax=Salpingoeca rosetta (strain ATCC 50818 / BSB-021) TaxID=946362 RepID=F2UI69_SALR5|nr:uncharacterized protein PTSG_08166 [Salpingoeca rosetta]EGD76818.1 hypothetical protein PTSG_08166 [Salpingoeca rosetta]|eukprot:XP_004991190.1 hypothetical protein PTSG_08166 [Salpingoeca rosetta]
MVGAHGHCTHLFTRVFYVTAVDENGQEFTTSPGPGFSAEVIFVRPGGKRSLLKSQWFDLGDGSFMCLFFFNEIPDKLIIKVSYRGHPVADSPYTLSGTTMEACDCPHASMDDFEYNYGCDVSDPANQIEADLAPFAGGISKELIDETMKMLDRNESCYVHYVIRNGRIFGQGHGPMQGFKSMMDDMLLSLASKTPLPDVEFVLNLGDWPLAFHASAHGEKMRPYPVFSWCSSTNHSDIVLPTYKMTTATIFGKNMEQIQVVDGKAGKFADWQSKRGVAFFRGRPSNQARVDAMLMSKERPDLVDARITKNQFNYFPNEEARREHRAFEAKYGKKAELQPIDTFFRNKYLLNIDGTVAAYRLATTLAGTSTLFKQESDYYEHFYNALEPWVHYVPVERNLSDLFDRVEYAQQHDDEMQAIARAGREFTRKHLRMPDIYCYHLRALRKYSRLLTFTPQVPPGMEEIVSDKARKQCPCPTFPGKPRWWSSDLVLGTGVAGALVAAMATVYARRKQGGAKGGRRRTHAQGRGKKQKTPKRK